MDAKTHHIVGYDVDFARALAKALGVKLELVATNPANRIPLLQSGKADLIVADITITPERAQVIDFSTPYFVTGQQFLVPAGSPDKLDEYSKARIGAVKGTTGEQALHQRFPQARVLSYDDIPLALTALRNGNVQPSLRTAPSSPVCWRKRRIKPSLKFCPTCSAKKRLAWA